jgi:prepilin-type N-terminal cleavage/methylation domain-containing protein
MYSQKKTSSYRGFTLIETVISVAIFSMIFIAVYSAYSKIFELIAVSRLRAIAMGLVEEKIEIARNLPYADVGTLTGIPRGKIATSSIEIRSSIPFTVTTVVRNIDDSFDGTIAGIPKDTSPADYKLVDMTVECATCKNFSPLSVSTFIAPKNLEISSSTNGALFVVAIDGNGQPISGASIHVENQSTTPPISIDDVTGASGMLQLVDIPPGIQKYQIRATKNNYTTDQTYTPGLPANPNPTKPHATVVAEQVTQLTFAIDQVSTMNFSSVTQTCTPVPNIDFTLSGNKLIGTTPDIRKYTATTATDGAGVLTIPNMEWDTYDLTLTDATYQLIGTNALSPIVLLPAETKNVDLIVNAQNPNTLMVTVKDAATELPISGASVRLEGAGVDETYSTGRGFLKQTDWSGGGGQATSTDATRYWSSDGNVDITNPVGEVKLKETFGFYQSSGELTSSAFDTGSASNFHELTWQPTAQAPQTGEGDVRFQIATNNDGGSWNFLGPDGTNATYYEVGTTSIHSIHNGDRYFRYKLFLHTASTTYTPNISDIAFTFTSACVPPGQASFENLPAQEYNLTVTKANYQTYSASTTIGAPWQSHVVVMIPN